jgi:hypothetical protein
MQYAISDMQFIILTTQSPDTHIIKKASEIKSLRAISQEGYIRIVGNLIRDL